jgi:hypothetical protein
MHISKEAFKDVDDTNTKLDMVFDGLEFISGQISDYCVVTDKRLNKLERHRWTNKGLAAAVSAAVSSILTYFGFRLGG